MSLVAKLKEVNLLRLLSDNELQSFSDASEETLVAKGAVIFKEDDPGDTLFLLTAGRVQISKHIVQNQEEVLPIVMEGDVFGELAFIDARRGLPRPPPSTIVRCTPSRRMHSKNSCAINTIWLSKSAGR